MAVSDIAEQIRKFIKRVSTPAEEAHRKTLPSGVDNALRHTTQDSGVHVRDDGCVEAHSAGASLLLDGKSGTVTATAKLFRVTTESVRFNTGSEGFHVNDGFLNPELLPSFWEPYGLDIAPYMGQALKRAPLLAFDENAWKQVFVTPEGGAVAFAQLFRPVTLFRRSNVIKHYKDTVKQILEELA